MSFKINYNLLDLPKREHECDFEYDPELNNITTFVSHLFIILDDDDDVINFNIFIDDIDLNVKYYFYIFVEQLDDSIKSILNLQNFEIDFFEGYRKIVNFKLIDEENYFIEILDGPEGEKLTEFGNTIVKKDYIYNLFLNIMNDFIRVSKIYCSNMYNNQYFQEMFKDYIKNI
jgi:hypothetical protein